MLQQLNRLFWSLLVAGFLVLILVTPALAAIAQPDSLSIEGVWVYQNCREEGDQLYLIYYCINYTTPPVEGADETYIVRLMDGDDTVEMAYPVAYHEGGYGFGVVALYFQVGDTPTWVGSYTMEIIGNPFQEWTGAPPSDTDSTFDLWQSLELNSAGPIIGSRIIWLANELETEWGVDMVTASDTGEDVLTSYAAGYFYNVVPYLTDIAPGIFPEGAYTPVDVVEPEIPPDTAGTGYADWLESLVPGTPFDLTPLATAFGVSRGPLTAFLYYGVVAFAMILIARQLGTYKPVMLFSIVPVILGAFVGVPLMATILAGFVSIGMIAFALFYKPSPT